MSIIAILLFPNTTQLDLTGPYEVLARAPGATVHLLWKNRAPVQTEHGLTMLPTATFDELRRVDVLCVPGGGGVDDLLDDEEVVRWVRERAATASYVTSVCTGALLLGAAGLLEGKKATTHWASLPMLAEFGAVPVKQRVVRDGKLITGGGVTAGIDFALTVVAELHGPTVAQAIQLGIEYAPAPPFDAGSPDTAPAEASKLVQEALQPRLARRLARVRTAAARLRRA